MSEQPKRKKRPHFVIAYKANLRDARLSLQARCVLLIIKSYANTNGTNCFPSMEKLCRDAGVPLRTLERYIAELKKARMITTVQRSIKGRKSSNFYLLEDDLRASGVIIRKILNYHRKRVGLPPATSGGQNLSKMADGEDPKIVHFTEKKREVS